MPQPPAPPTDPWGAPLPGPPGQKHHPPAPAPAVSPPPSDPWGSAKPAPSNQSDPWGMPMPSNPSPSQANPGIIHDSFVLNREIFSCYKFDSVSVHIFQYNVPSFKYTISFLKLQQLETRGEPLCPLQGPQPVPHGEGPLYQLSSQPLVALIQELVQ